MIYAILYASSPTELTRQVMKHIKAGWIPQGGISMTATTIAQAMVKGGNP